MGGLNEGFATFFEKIERQDRLGKDEYLYGIEAELESYLSEAGNRYQRAIVCRDYGAPIDLFDRHLYEKGCLVLHLLRTELGDELFWKGIHEYLRRHAHGIVETNDLMRALEDVSGRSLERFFDAWVYRPGHPIFKVKVSYDDGLLTVGVKQTQKTGETAVFPFELEIEVADKAGKTRRLKKHVDGANDALVVSCHERPQWVGVDLDYRLVGELHGRGPGRSSRRTSSSPHHAAPALARGTAGATPRSRFPRRPGQSSPRPKKPGWCAPKRGGARQDARGPRLGPVRGDEREAPEGAPGGGPRPRRLPDAGGGACSRTARASAIRAFTSWRLRRCACWARHATSVRSPGRAAPSASTRSHGPTWCAPVHWTGFRLSATTRPYPT
ncbi:MAG: M1 family aminopeptidase [Polyangiaceae bacterium]